MGDPYDPLAGGETVSLATSLATRLAVERANLEAAWLADAEVASEHVLLALTGSGCFVLAYLKRCGIPAEAVRQRVVDATEGVALPAPPERLEPPPADGPDPMDALDLAANPLGHDPRRRLPWGSRGFGVALDRPPKTGMLGRQYFVDRDGYPVLTTDGKPVHIVVDEDTLPVLDEHGQHRFGPVEIPPGGRLIVGHDDDQENRAPPGRDGNR